ncbi:hypothetical protein GCM10010358_39330 [Streptomyces minutiscleroticus]|uniref:STAS domain-containing protein n=1 Tax=Streptomyces minutiscleroticus TaxID=68238 RepID=A0A918NMP5_9ACTN|nr:STAS domain-containing protein [Streptomyces minutiscleroticus]GGX81152.1 hypothetical protein GCM10010358_39330 [Streptomyces minutiscleroticus]
MVQRSGCELVLREVRVGDDAVWLGVVGELGLDEVQLLTETVVQLAQEKKGRERQVVLDLSDVSYCGHDAAFTLWGMCAGFRTAGISVALAEVSTMAQVAFEGAHLDKRLPFYQR